MNKVQLSKIANPVIAAIVATEQSQVKLGDAVIAASTKLDKKSIKPFCNAIKVALEKKGFTPSSIKVTTMYIRRVVTAIVVDGFEPEPGQSLRSIYAALPKKATGGASHAPRLPNPAVKPDKAANAEVPAVESAVDAAERFKDAVSILFGSCDTELLAAVQYAAANKPIFVKWAHASMKAAALVGSEPTKHKKRAAVTA